MASVLHYLGWAVLPNYATALLQTVYYGITVRAGSPRPMPGTPRHDLHRRRIFIFVVTSYLLYTLYETFHQVQVAGDFYQALGVSPFADERTIKSKFRRLAAQHHPDKIGPDGGAEVYFMYLRQAQETLANPVRRFAYDRFGPDMLSWGEQKTMGDFITVSFTRSLVPHYVGGFVTMLVLNWLWWANWGRYWRFYTFAAMLTLELALITHPQAVFMPATYLPTWLRAWMPEPAFHLLPFQTLTLARRASILLHIFISQIAPPSARAPGGGDKISPQTMQRMGQLVVATRQADLEATRVLQVGLAPFRGDRESVSALRRGMKEGLILGGVRSSAEVQRAVAQVVERRKMESQRKVD
ncbi:uncharacterized protein N7498_006193 [Penicillium cinerascens]|uniref:J domain-containing protein n=1 Tax=Penicillium cinerascens TaxID=70096 RepID=A0A9W9SXE0_9EURO|nr:uncharacterized protein N7498_006193 [Penicillium cinerascens]KAJ5201530.1 hypothetical protein N7498_006193 [Penicillium cinerascens]